MNAVLAVTMTLAMASTGFRIVDTAAMCLGITGVAMVFGAVAAVTAQLWRQARTATGAAMAALAVAALVRGIGDVINNSGSALSWFSPIAWAQQMRPFVDLRWWPFALLVALTVALMVLAAWLESRRQYDDGSSRPPVSARTRVRSRACSACTSRLQRGQTIGWTVGLFLAGLAFGSMTKSLLDAAKDNPLLARVLTAQGTDGVYTTMTQFLAAAATAYVVSAVLRVYNDEESGLGEAVLAGAVSRWRWLLTAVGAAAGRVDRADVLRRAGQRARRGHHASVSRRPSGASRWPGWPTCLPWRSSRALPPWPSPCGMPGSAGSQSHSW